MNQAAAAVLAAVAGAIAADVINAPLQSRVPGRIRPPDTVTCSRDRLTAYTGTVTRLTRERQRTVLEIRTDWDTTEEVVVTHDGDRGPEQWFLVRMKPFEAANWAEIEVAPGQLRRGVRATAWVCDGRKNPTIDWNPAAEPPPGR